MVKNVTQRPARRRVLQGAELLGLPQLARLPASDRRAMAAVARVLPFGVNRYVIDELIDWTDVPRDPMFQLTFPQPDMLAPEQRERVLAALDGDPSGAQADAVAREIQCAMNPHPAGQTNLNVPWFEGRPLEGVQHKYRDTVLFFPSRGQTCLSYCSYCFRWPQFVGLDGLKFAARESEQLVAYLRTKPDVTSVLFTGGDPLVMSAAMLRRYVEPILKARLPGLLSLRLGTKAPAFWPQRFLEDGDCDDLLRLFEEIVASGLHLAVMAHYSHPRELETDVAQAALRRIVSTGAVVRCQAPMIAHVNDRAQAWSRLWRQQIKLGAVPYYLFVARDTGPRDYFALPLARALRVFADAQSSTPGLARTVRGPSMSAAPGKVLVDGVTTIGSERVFVLRFARARDPRWEGRPFFAHYDARATWFDELRPAQGHAKFFFEDGMRRFEDERAWRGALRARSSPVGEAELADAN